MNLSSQFIKRPVMTALVMLAFVVFGSVAYNVLPVASIPSIAFPTIQVQVSYPGASPDVMARHIAAPLERQFTIMPGIKMVSSQNTYESTQIVLQFHMDVDVNVAATETQEAITQAMTYLPADLPSEPTYTKSNPSDTPIMFIVASSKTMRESDLYKYGYNFIGQQLGLVNGVADINTYGFPYAVRVQVDPGALAARNISLNELSQVIKDNNPDLPTGKFYNKSHSITTVSHGQITTAEGYNNLIIKYQDDGPVRIKDIGKAFDSVENNKESFQWDTKDGKEAAVVLAIFKTDGYNTVKICKNLMETVDRLKKDLPDSINITIPYTQSTWIEEALYDVEFTLAVSFLLVVLVVFIYLGKIRNTLIPVIALPITLTATFIAMYVLGYSLDILSLSAFTLAIGFLVDDAIVVLENVVRRIQGGEKPYFAAINGSGQIGHTILSISMCLCAAFLPMLFMSGALGEIFHEFAAVIILAVLFSLFISLTLTPMLCSRFIPPYEEQAASKTEQFSEWLNEKLLSLYKKPLAFCLRHKFIILLSALSSVALSAYLFVITPRSFIPPSDIGLIECFAQADDGTSPHQMKAYMDQAAALLIKHPDVETVARINSYPTDNQGVLFLNLKEKGRKKSVWEIIGELEMQSFEDVIGCDFFMKAYPLINLQVGTSQSGKANYQYVLTSYDEDKLYEAAENMMISMKKDGAFSHISSDMQLNAPYLDINLRRDEAYAYSQIDALDIENTMMYAYGEAYVTKMNMPENMYWVILEVLDSFVENPQNIDDLYIVQKGKPVALKNVIDVKATDGPATINHINTLTSVTISFDSGQNVPLSETVAHIEQIAGSVLPDQVDGFIAGNTAQFKSSNAQLQILIALSLFVMYLILGTLYENFIHPITPLSAIPVAGIGGLGSLLLTGYSMSVYAFIGLIMLLGIVLKNGILVVDFALHEMKENGKSCDDAIFAACIARFRPIIMTTLAALMGAVPLALGIGGAIATSRIPIGVVIVGGLIFSQGVTLFVTPVIFLYVHRFQEFIFKRTKFFNTHEMLEAENKE